MGDPKLVALKGSTAASYYPKAKQVRELPVSSWSEWDHVRLVKAAIRELESGDFSSAALVVDAMGRDDRIEGVMSTRAGALPSLPMTMEPRGDGRQAKMVAKEAEELFDQMLPDDALTSLVNWGVMLGVGLGQLKWDREAVVSGKQRWNFKLEVFHPRFLRWDWETRSYKLQTEEGEVTVTPGDGQWVVYTPYGFNRGWMRGHVRSLYMPWLVRSWAFRDWARYSEVLGQPIRKAVAPNGATDEEAEAFAAEVAQMGAESVVPTKMGPSGQENDRYDVELLEAEGKSSETFEKLIEMANACVAINLLGQNLSTEVKGGSFAAAKGHLQIREDVLTSDAELLAECLRQQALAPWAAYNFGSRELAPLPMWKTRAPDDRVAKGNGYKALGEGIAALKGVGVKLDVDAMVEADEIPVTAPAEDVKVPPPGSAPKSEAGAGEKAKVTKATQVDEDLDPAAIAGQLYVDEGVETGTAAAAKVLRPDLHTLLTLIEEGKSYEDIRKALLKAYRGMDRSELAELMRKSFILADLAGRHAVNQEAEEDR